MPGLSAFTRARAVNLGVDRTPVAHALAADLAIRTAGVGPPHLPLTLRLPRPPLRIEARVSTLSTGRNTSWNEGPKDSTRRGGSAAATAATR